MHHTGFKTGNMPEKVTVFSPDAVLNALKQVKGLRV